jgi:hypothetical protein
MVSTPIDRGLVLAVGNLHLATVEGIWISWMGRIVGFVLRGRAEIPNRF